MKKADSIKKQLQKQNLVNVSEEGIVLNVCNDHEVNYNFRSLFWIGFYSLEGHGSNLSIDTLRLWIRRLRFRSPD